MSIFRIFTLDECFDHERICCGSSDPVFLQSSNQSRLSSKMNLGVHSYFVRSHLDQLSAKYILNLVQSHYLWDPTTILVMSQRHIMRLPLNCLKDWDCWLNCEWRIYEEIKPISLYVRCQSHYLWLSRKFRESRFDGSANRWRASITYKILLPRHKRGRLFGAVSRILRTTVAQD